MKIGNLNATSFELVHGRSNVRARIGSFDPDTDNRTESDGKRSWRYLFNRVGDFAVARDTRGFGQLFYHDYAGRLIAEDYV